MDYEPPIQNLYVIDVLARRADDGIDLAIACSGPLDDSADTLSRLDQKISGYLAEVQTESFQKEFGSPDRAPIRVLVVCQYAVSAAAQGLINVLAKKAEVVGVELKLVESVT